MGPRSTMVHTLFVVVVVAVMAVSVKSQNHIDHRCRYTETKVDNCTRMVYYPCPEPADDSDESSEEDSSEEDSSEAPLSSKRRSIEDFIASIMRRYWGGNSDNWCKREETFTCVMYRCYISCCPGWKFDENTQTCSIREDPTPGIECQNGGNAVQGPDGWRCDCPAMYTGSRCEEVKCDLECLNGGMCDLVDGSPRCMCSEDFSGPRCEQPICDGECGAYGTCVPGDGQAMCRCFQGYTGRNCEIRTPEPEKEGDCPPVTSGTVGTCAVTCQTDANCADRQKCCHNGCGRMCMQPANYTCIYNNRRYTIGQRFTPDACRVCTCLNPDITKRYGGAQCSVQTCPPLQDNCQKVVRSNGTCCPNCADVQKPNAYSQPRFLNCPESIVTVDVAQGRNEARLPFTLDARDYQDNYLPVILSRILFQAGLGEENFDTVIATSSRDSMGNFITCEFHVRIRDVQAPNFTFCPTDVHLTQEGEATWDPPRAEDNVGLMRPPTSRHKPGDYFRKGEHPVVYSSEDYEGNIARCHFFVKVAQHERSRMVDGRSKHRHLMFIGSGIAAFLFIILIIVVAIICRRRRSGRREEARSPPSYENGIYQVGAGMPPPYKEKPPVYVSETDVIPEKKEEGDGDKAPLDAEDVDIKFGVDNPTYRL